MFIILGRISRSAHNRHIDLVVLCSDHDIVQTTSNTRNNTDTDIYSYIDIDIINLNDHDIQYNTGTIIVIL